MQSAARQAAAEPSSMRIAKCRATLPLRLGSTTLAETVNVP